MSIRVLALAIICVAAIGALHSSVRAQQAVAAPQAPPAQPTDPAQPAAPAPQAAATPPTASPQSVWDGVYTEEQAQRGDALYREYCANCHAVDWESGGEMAPPLAGPAFSSNWTGLTLGDLYERNRTTMPADGPGRLSAQQNADILAYILRLNRLPAGKTELARQAELLKQIKFQTIKN